MRPRAMSPPVWVVASILTIGTVAAYANSLRGPFVFDDLNSIQGNESIRNLASGNWLRPPRTALTVVGRPLASLSFAINYAVNGIDPFGFHVVNLVIHVLAGLLLFGVVRRTLQTPTVPENLRSFASETAAAVALLWMVHPLQTESVTYIVQRTESLGGLWYLLAMYASIRAADSSRPKWWEMCAVPRPLTLDYGSDLIADPVTLAFAAAVVVAGMAAIVWIARGRPWVGFAGFTFAALLAPTSSIVPLYGQVAAEHRMYMYMPLALVIASVVLPLANWLSRKPSATRDATSIAFRRLLFCAAWSCVASALGVLTWTRNLDYRSARAIWTDTVAHRPHNVRALRNLVHSLFAEDEFGEAIPYLERMISLQPDDSQAYMNLGAACLKVGRLEPALRALNRSLELNPRYAGADGNRARIYAQLGRRDECVADFRRAVEYSPSSQEFRNGLGCALRDSGDFAGAVRELDAAIALNPTWPLPLLNRGGVHALRGQTSSAVRDLEHYLRLQGNSPEAYQACARVWLKAGDLPRARQNLKAAIEGGLAPDPQLLERLCSAIPTRANRDYS